MPIHTVDEMLALKAQYTQKPFANFSLSNCIARKKQGERLERGANAWGGRHAVTVGEARTRQIQHSLNKVSEEKYEEVVNELQKAELFEPETMKSLVAGVFQKALAEPFLAPLYANLCFSLARFEVSGENSSTSATPSPSSTSKNATPGSSSSTPSPSRPKSLFRATIVAYAQTEFEKEMKMVSPKSSSSSEEKLSAEEKEALRQEREEEAERLLKRKRANIKFVGHLFKVNVLSFHVMKTIVNFILRLKETPMFCPSELDLDVLTILLTTIGERIDESSEPDQRQFLDEVMSRIQTLETRESKRYTMRVRTKVMNLLDLRSKNWTEKRNAASLSVSNSTNATPASLKSPMYTTPFSRNTTSAASNKIRGGNNNNNTGSESERSSNVGSTNFDSRKHALSFPDTPASSNPNASTPQVSTPISFKSALLASAAPSPSSTTATSSRPNNNNTHKQQQQQQTSSNNNNNASTTGILGRGESPAPFFRSSSTSPSPNNNSNNNNNSAQQTTSASTANKYKPPSYSASSSTTTTTTTTSTNKKNLPPPATVSSSSSSSTAAQQQQGGSGIAATKDDSATSSNTAAAASSSSNSNATASSSTRPISRVIQETFREWLCSHSVMRNWQQRFAGYNKTEEEIRASIVRDLVYEACLTTRPDAQVEAVMFCKQGLSFGHFDFYPGFQKILRKALAEGVLTDVPKFFDRLMIAMHYAAVQQQQQSQASGSNNHVNSNSISSSEPKVKSNRTGLFRQLAQLMFAVAESNPLDDDSPEANEEVADGLLRLWQCAPRDEAADDAVVDFILRPRACANNFPEMVVEMLTFGVHEAKVLSAEPVNKWLASEDSKDSPLKNLLEKNFSGK